MRVQAFLLPVAQSFWEVEEDTISRQSLRQLPTVRRPFAVTCPREKSPDYTEELYGNGGASI